MFRNVLNTSNEYLRRVLDLLHNKHNNKNAQSPDYDRNYNYNNSNKFDINNNNLNSIKRTKNKKQRTSKPKPKPKRNKPTPKPTPTTAQQSLNDEFDWFKQINRNGTKPSSSESSLTSSQSSQSSLSSALSPDSDEHLKSFYTLEKPKKLFKKKKMINQIQLSSSAHQDDQLLNTSSQSSLIMSSIDYTLQNDYSYPHNLFNLLISSSSTTTSYSMSIIDNLNDHHLHHQSSNQNIIKAVKLFQKLYYKESIKGEKISVPSWRMKDKMKTVSAALVMCLNIGVEPPDVVKTSQCSKQECWINPMNQTTPQRALEMIGAELQKQYERWQPRARYKHCLDPTSEDVKKLCISLRKNAKDERVLFHYNGHGVPRPTVNGEIWVFNKEFTQYIPLSLYEVQTWMGTPSLYVWDCSNAGLIVQSFLQFEEDRENEISTRTNSTTTNTTNLDAIQTKVPLLSPSLSLSSQPAGSAKIRDSIHLAACASNELIPQHPDLPMDLFTACLTTPIKTALHWYVAQKNSCQLIPGLTVDLLEKIPGQINDRRTMMGELNWIFTAITDTIAWNVLDSDLFQKLFRQDLLVASLFRNFLLAERIMKSLDCNPISHPSVPSTNEHPLWQSWDLALDMCISQLPSIFNTNGHQKDFVSCGFFTEQIEIFDVWLRYNVNSQSPPEQLPVVLQVLLSQQHRLKALELLAKFIDFGAWAVSAALSVGIFPYVLKLLTTQPRELRPLLTFIWAKILAVDKSCQADLVKDNGHVYFIHVLSDADVEPTQKVYSAFVLSCLVDKYPTGQESAKQNHLIAACSYLLTDERTRDYKHALLRQWVCICLGLCWQNYPEARWEGVRNNAHEFLIKLVSDRVPEVRAAAIFALGTYIGCGQGNEATVEQTNKIDSEIVNALIKDYDIVYLVRKEIISALYNYVYQLMTQTTSSTSAQSIANNKEAVSSNTTSGVSSAAGSGSPLTSGSANPQFTRSLSATTLSQPSTKSASSSATITQSSLINTIVEHVSSSLTTVKLQDVPKTAPIHNIHNIHHSSSTTSNLSQTKQQQFLSNSSSSAQLLVQQQNQMKRAFSIEQQSRLNQTLSPNQKMPGQLSNSLLLPNSNKMVNNLFIRVWNLLLEMQSDPYPDVAELAQKVVAFFLGQIQNFDFYKQTLILKQTNANFFNSNLNSSNENQSFEITTDFVAWCCKYFLKPLLSTQTAPASSISASSSPSSSNLSMQSIPQQTQQFKEDNLLINQKIDLFTSEHLDQHCKLLYNYKRAKMPNEWKEAQQMDELIQIKHSAYPTHVKFHPFDEQLFVADKDCMISVYEASNNCSKLSSFSILPEQQIQSNLKKPIITSFKLINIQHEPIILTGTDDRVVRFFKPDGLNSAEGSSKLITAFTAFNDNQKRKSNKEAGLIVDWDEPNEVLLCAGDTDYIRVWDMNKELYKDYSTSIESCVCSLSTSDNYTVAGFGDGTIKLFDFRRSQPFNLAQLDSSAKTQFYSTKLFVHDSFVLKVKLHKQSNKLITSGTLGDINVFDMRSLKKAMDTSFNNEIATALECHSYNELVAVANCTAPNQSIKVYDFKGKELSCIKHHDGFYGKRISTVSCLDWNLHKNEVLFGSCDNCITVFRSR